MNNPEAKKKKKKVIWVAQYPNEIYVGILDQIAKQNTDIDFTMVVIKSPSKSAHFQYKELKHRMIPKIFLFHRVLSNVFQRKPAFHFQTLSYFEGLWAFLDEEKPDLVMSNLYWRLFSFQTYSYAKKNNIPFILFEEKKFFRSNIIEKILSKFSIWLAKPMFQYSKAIFCWTQDSVNFAKKHFSVTDKEKIKRISAGIDTDLFYPSQVPEKTESKSSIDFLIVARLIPFKKHSDLLQAFARAHKKSDKTLTLSILGEGALKEKIKEQIKALGIEESIHFLEKVPHAELGKTYYKYDCLILPSENEPIGMVVPEAMASGLPVIVSDTVGAKDYVLNGENGYIFETGNIDDLAKKMLRFANLSPEERAQHSRSAAEHIKKHFSLQKVAEKLEKVIKMAMR
jgi:glycosyltransferase involved in cell wall biosynthesis